jgi:hypothetical protein
MQPTDSQKRTRVCDLNDAFRKTLDRTLGRVMLTAGVSELPPATRALVIRTVGTFDAFNADSDPHGEHDFGNFELARRRLFWKIDYYDPSLSFGSEDPSDPSKTMRVLTIMLAEEY